MRRWPFDAVFSAIGSLALVALWSTSTWPVYIDAACVILAFLLLIPLVRILLAQAAVSFRDDADDSHTHHHP